VHRKLLHIQRQLPGVRDKVMDSSEAYQDYRATYVRHLLTRAMAREDRWRVTFALWKWRVSCASGAVVSESRASVALAPLCDHDFASHGQEGCTIGAVWSASVAVTLATTSLFLVVSDRTSGACLTVFLMLSSCVWAL
jgi:hypothetical protein